MTLDEKIKRINELYHKQKGVGQSKKAPRHHRLQERFIPILNVDLSRQRLSIIRIFWITEAFLQREKKVSLVWKEKIMLSKTAM